jgi:hypothetical protein
MADKTENILVEFDYNNITIVDPNKVIDLDGNIKDRYVNQEDLVMYANLECKVLPRTKLAVGVSMDSIQTVTIATLNFLNPGNKSILDNAYTDEITGLGSLQGKGVNQPGPSDLGKTKKSDEFYNQQVLRSNGKVGATDNGLLGITNISINQDLSFLPTVDMMLEDVKGKALFEGGNNSPYAAFFNLPYPLFTLTIKGYYGKAIKLALMLQNFSSRYDTSKGNFMVSCKFYTYKYTMLSEISMGYLVATPHMYQSRLKVQTQQGGPSNFTNVEDQVVERGYQKIKEMYNEYKSKGLIPDNFPELTIVQLRNNIENFVKNTLESFTKQNLDPLTDLDLYSSQLAEFEKDVYYYLNGKSWFDKNMDRTNFLVLKNKEKVYTFKPEITTDQAKSNAKTELDAKIKEYQKKLEENKTVGKNGAYTVNGKQKAISIPFEITMDTFSAPINEQLVDLKETYRAVKKVKTEPTDPELTNFKNELIKNGVFNNYDGKDILGFKLKTTEWFKFEGNQTFLFKTGEMSKKLKVFREEIESALTDALSTLLQSSDNGIGFTPTIRNVMAVVFANGEGFIRLMDEVHTKAWDVREDEDRKKSVLSKEIIGSPDNLESGANETTPIYPWPSFIVATPGDDGQEKYEIQYPGDPKYINKTKGYVFDIWPEIEFVEEFIKGYVQRTTPPADPTAGNNSATEAQRVSLNAIEYPITDEVFANKEEVKYLYEIYERLILYHYYSRLSRTVLNSEVDAIASLIAEAESTNILKSLSNDNPFLIKTLKEYGINSANFVSILKGISNGGVGENWQNFIRGIFNTTYIKNLTESSSFEILNFNDPISLINNLANSSGTQSLVSLKNENKLIEYLNSTSSNVYKFGDLYPFTNTQWVRNSLANGITISSAENSFNTTKVITFNGTKKIISNFIDADNNYKKRPFSNFLGEGGVTNNFTPFFVDSSIFYSNRVVKYDRQNFTEGNLNYINYSGNVSASQTVSMLNTPYFVNAIQDGVEKFRNSDQYPYKAAAYLFLNSLPLSTFREKYKSYENGATVDLDYIFATLKKFGAIHKVPYAWLLKIGSVWHRYKTFVETGVDIISSSWSGFNYTYNFDPVTNNPQTDYILDIGNGNNVDIILEKTTTIGTGDTSTLINVGFYPKTINDFNVFYQGLQLFTGYTSQDIQSGFTYGMQMIYIPEAIISRNKGFDPNNLNRDLRIIPWTVYSKSSDGNTFYLLPSEGSFYNQTIDECFSGFNKNTLTLEVAGNNAIYNGSVRTFWAAPNYGYFDVNKVIKPTPLEYLKQVFSGQSNQQNFSINGNSSGYTEISEMFSVFDKEILDMFEGMYLDYSKSVYDSLDGNFLKNFQSMMRTISAVPKSTGTTSQEILADLGQSQIKNVNNYVKDFLNLNVYIKYGNPINYNKKLFYSFSQLEIVDPITYNFYSVSTPNALPYNGGGISLSSSKSNYPDEWKELETYVGFSEVSGLTYSSNGSYITDFFIDLNVAFTTFNIQTFAPLIKIYATEKLKDNTLDKDKFINLVTNYILEVDSFQDKVVNNLFTTLRKNLPTVNNDPENRVSSDLEGPQSKLELWEAFKALNDKWIAGGEFKNKTLFEDVLFLDRASRDIGNKILVDVYKLKNRLQNILDSPKVSMLVFVQTIIQENNFVIMNLPSYVNFYNVQEASKNQKPKPEGTLEFANTLFGTFLNVDYRDTGPKMVCLYGGKPSEQLDLKENVDYRFNSDAFDLSKVSNPLVEDQTGKSDWAQSNKVVGFNVDIGPQNQSMFYSFMVDQKNSQSTVESLEVINQMANQAGNRGGSTQSLSLYNLYKNRSYTCTISMMGNALIQPTMYFNLRYVPMFKGPYMILTVNHTITPGSFETIFTGIRQPTASLPKIENYIQNLRNNLLKSIIENNKKDKEAKEKETKDANDNVNSQKDKVVSTANAGKTVSNPQLCKPNSIYSKYVVTTPTERSATISSIKSTINSSINANGVSTANANKLRYVVFATLWLGSIKDDSKFTAYDYNFAGIQLGGNWGPSDTYFKGNQQYFCLSSDFDAANTTSNTNAYAVFDDAYNNITLLVKRWENRMVNLPDIKASSITKFWIENFGPTTLESNVYTSMDTTQLKIIEDIVQKSIDTFNATN